jgi:hypothetical protein
MAIGNCIDTALSMFNDVVSWKSASVLADAESSATELMNASREITGLEELDSLTVLCDKVAVQVDVELADMSAPWVARAAGTTSALIEDSTVMVSKWTNIAKITDVMAKGFSIAMLAAGCVVSGMQIADDFSSDQPASVKALDILSEVSMGITFLVTAGAGIAGLLGIEVCIDCLNFCSELSSVFLRWRHAFLSLGKLLQS